MKKINFRKLIGPILIWWVMRYVVREKSAYDIDVSVQDILGPEENATVQSFNSRSAGGFVVNLKKLIMEGFEKIMKKFYSGYGHKSIGDCGSTTAALDGLSMLAAKGTQEWELYNGQETSTRYINVSRLGYVDRIGTFESERIMTDWFDFYKNSLPDVIAHLKQLHPCKESEKESDWAVMIEKRAYDILGSFLPAGARTNVSVHMNLRQWDEKLSYMVHHSLDEVADLGKTILKAMQKKYPSTFVKAKIYPKSESYRRKFMHDAYHAKDISGDIQSAEFNGFSFQKNFQYDDLIDQRKEIASERPEKTELPKIFNQAGSYTLRFLIDYRSFRDLQRQRSATQDAPLLTMEYGFERWYLDQLPETVRIKAEKLIALQKERVLALTDDVLIRQYYIAMGYKVFTRFTVGLSNLVYIIELRTPTTVHPTARAIAIKAYYALREYLPKYFTMYAETKDDELDIKRADQDLFLDGKRISEM